MEEDKKETEAGGLVLNQLMMKKVIISNCIFSLCSAQNKEWSIIDGNDDSENKDVWGRGDTPSSCMSRIFAIFLYEIFWNINDPPKLAFLMIKNFATKFFGSEITSPPPFGTFPKIHR